MKKNDIYLKDFIQQIWNDKKIIFFISLLSLISAFVFTNLVEKENQIKVNIVVKTPPAEMFSFYDTLYSSMTEYQVNFFGTASIVEGTYSKAFFRNMKSIDNLSRFSKKDDDFREYFKLNNINVAEFFYSRFGQPTQNKQVVENKYFLIFPQSLNGAKFLDNYVVYIKDITLAEIKNQLRVKLVEKISEYEHNLTIAEEIKLEDPLIIQNMSENNKRSSVVTEPTALFFKGSKVIKKQISYLNKKLEDFDGQFFDYNPILDRSITESIRTSKNYTLYGLFLGLFFSLLIVFLRTILR